MNRSYHRITALALGASLAIVLAACADDLGLDDSPIPSETSSPVSSNAVEIRDIAFSPAVITVPAGGTVTWTNRDTPPHDVTFADGERSQRLDTGSSYSRTFSSVGTFDYVCTIHPNMSGRVIVTDGS